MTQAAQPAQTESLVATGEDMNRALKRIAHEIVERNGAGSSVVIAGIPTRGVPLARRLGAILGKLGGVDVEVLELPIEGHRDDRPDADTAAAEPSVRPAGDVNGRAVVLVDDVIFHGRTARAALDALTELGRPAAVQLAVMVDRGHRELPIRADYVGKNIPTQMSDRVRVMVKEIDGVDSVFLLRDCD
ncbi:MAG TPA: bifunctional pyr operon transcriptional regulator/uracil phosphoribosyltransferase PyrR [Candidatus Dormibacteraeota bacterium]|jgi:pyrimidine operon attenuation protein/uracil phosphoribosyltransferase|nr:bifunctional pyr operon transcriptional regulator/uracil phosphoribosyltransferase PyrR [Candidatus Dormibacteraeota bacterium]